MYRNFIWKSSRSKQTPQRLRAIPYKPKVEALEERQLLSVTTLAFAVDQSASTVTLSGDVSGTTILPQGAGSLTSSFTGSIVAQWDQDNQTIQFIQAGTVLNAANSGNWQPLPGGASGSAPANYGGKIVIVIFTANIALRNLAVSGFSETPLPLVGTGPYNFGSTQTLTVLAGAADYNAGFLGSGSTNIAGLSASNQAPTSGTFEDLGNGAYRVTEPISLTVRQPVGGFLATLHIDGQVVGNVAVPFVNLSGTSGTGFNYVTAAVGGGGPFFAEDQTATVTGTPTANLTSMTVTLLNHPDDVNEFLGYDLGSSGLTTNGYDPVSGQLVITGSADPSIYQTVLRTITYENRSSTPDTSDRMIQFVVNDGSNTSAVRTTTVSVSAPVSPAPPPGLVIVKQPFLTNGSSTISSSLEGALSLTHSQPILNSLSPDLKTAVDDLTTSLLTSSSSGAVRVPSELGLPLEGLATDLGVFSA